GRPSILVEPVGDGREVLLHTVQPGGEYGTIRPRVGYAVATLGADRVQLLGVVKMGHRDDPRPIGFSSREDAIGEDRSEGGARLVRFETPLIQDDKRARGLDEVEEIGNAGDRKS